MKTVAFTAMMALLVTIPLILGKRKLQAIRVKGEKEGTAPSDENQRYDIDDFLS